MELFVIVSNFENRKYIEQRLPSVDMEFSQSVF